MTIAKFQELTGTTVPASKTTLVTAQLKRAENTLESLLGYPLCKNEVSDNLYEELGKTQQECEFDIDGTLEDPDEVQGAYRLFPYNKLDAFYHLDPFITVYAVKLVFIKVGEEPNGVTVKTFEDNNIRINKDLGIKKYLQLVNCGECLCVSTCSNQYRPMLAVDADWLYEDCLPNDLLYLWTDLVSQESDLKGNIKSETLGPHSYTKFDKGNVLGLFSSVALLSRYSGPNGLILQNSISLRV